MRFNEVGDLLPFFLVVGIVFSLPQPIQHVVNWLRGIGTDVANLIGDAVGAAFDAIRAWIWFPLRHWIQLGYAIVEGIPNWLQEAAIAVWNFRHNFQQWVFAALDYVVGGLGHAIEAIPWLIDQVNWLIDQINFVWQELPNKIFEIMLDGIDFIIVQRFIDILEAISGPLEDYIVAHWDD